MGNHQTEHQTVVLGAEQGNRLSRGGRGDGMVVRSSGDAPPIDKVVASAYRIPTDRPEGDGTIQWNATGMIIVKVVAGGTSGLGYSYTQALPAAVLVRDVL